MTDLRIVISCVTFEVAKIIKPIEHYRADKVYLIHQGGKAPYDDFLVEVKEQLGSKGFPYECRETRINDFAMVLKALRGIIISEREAGNHVYVNIGAGPQIYSSAAMIACMMEGAAPFTAPTKEFTVKNVKEVFYRKGRPVGMALDIMEPHLIPTFKIETPEPDLVKGLGIWVEMERKYHGRCTKEAMKGLAEAGLLSDIFDDAKREKVSQGALMRFRRNFLEKWDAHGWVRRGKRGSYALTEEGEKMLQIFG